MTLPKERFKEYRLFGLKMREARKDLGLSISQLSQVMDLSEATLCTIELGKQGVYLRTAIQLANMFNISLDEIRDQVADGNAALELRRKVADIKRHALEQKIEEVRKLNEEYEALKK